MPRCAGEALDALRSPSPRGTVPEAFSLTGVSGSSSSQRAAEGSSIIDPEMWLLIGD